LAVVALHELGPVSGEVLDEPPRGVDDPGHADQAARPAYDLSRDELAVPAAEGVDDPATRDRLSDEGRKPGDRGGVGLAGKGEERTRAFVVGVGE